MSAILSSDDLNDFISPGVACIKPIETLPSKKIPTDEDGLEISLHGEFPFSQDHASLPPAQISLTDCLACSGCVTSAEAILVSLQSHTEVLNELDSAPALRIHPNGTSLENLEHGGKIYVASVSPQSRASLAAAFGVSQREAGYMIEQLLSGSQGIKNRAVYRNFFQWVIDTNVARNACLVLGVDEVLNSLQGREERSASEDSKEPQAKMPLLTSSCPGWICYAEKTHPYILPHLSKLKSPQAITGTILKTTLSKIFDISPQRIWHVAIMPCYDKKLEASREELTDHSWAGCESKGIRDVDSVMTTRELLLLADVRRVDFAKLPRYPVQRIPFPDPKLESFLFPSDKNLLSNRSYEFGPSGGYLYYILNYFVSQNKGSKIHMTRGRNADVLEYSVISCENEILIKAARYYGFRNIQNLVRRLKPPNQSRIPGVKPKGIVKKSLSMPSGTDFTYIEVMACPGGCTNGGGQIKVDDPVLSIHHNSEANSRPLSQKEWISKVDEAYFSGDDILDETQNNNQHEEFVDGISRGYIKEILAHWANLTGIYLPRLVYTTFRRVESDVGKKIDHSQNVMRIASKIGGGW
ncbi:putative iron only hydrogenase large subunit domain-containing protein [Erysiphe necator]|uniref:Nuclear architecture-related protein 1 n=1 Tax=Uncinula necator TaxID=52586 RepID=A0A0B1P9W8_UNCNE|nr:putative iron only hydrogenase large subunit domain-containing protein [Erysiphe necator]